MIQPLWHPGVVASPVLKSHTAADVADPWPSHQIAPPAVERSREMTVTQMPDDPHPTVFSNVTTRT